MLMKGSDALPPFFWRDESTLRLPAPPRGKSSENGSSDTSLRDGFLGALIDKKARIAAEGEAFFTAEGRCYRTAQPKQRK